MLNDACNVSSNSSQTRSVNSPLMSHYKQSNEIDHSRRHWKECQIRSPELAKENRQTLPPPLELYFRHEFTDDLFT